MLRISEERCPKCGSSVREERSHVRCEVCGITEACCEGAATDECDSIAVEAPTQIPLVSEA